MSLARPTAHPRPVRSIRPCLAFAIELEKTNIKVNVCLPRSCRHELNDLRGFRTVEQGRKAGGEDGTYRSRRPDWDLGDEEGTVPW